jgi:PhnB protein
MQTITPYLLYEDVEAALDFLNRAFGFEEVLRYTGGEGYISHAEMQISGASIYLGDPGDDYKSPKRLGQRTVGVNVLVDDVDATFERARAAGVTVQEEPTDQPYGERRFIADDLEGHRWFIATPMREVAAEDWGAVTPG